MNNFINVYIIEKYLNISNTRLYSFKIENYFENLTVYRKGQKEIGT